MHLSANNSCYSTMEETTFHSRYLLAASKEIIRAGVHLPSEIVRSITYPLHHVRTVRTDLRVLKRSEGYTRALRKRGENSEQMFFGRRRKKNMTLAHKCELRVRKRSCCQVFEKIFKQNIKMDAGKERALHG